MTFGDALRARRQELGLHQRDVAARVGVSAQYLSDMEAGRRATPSDHVVHALAGELGLSYGYLSLLLGRVPAGLWAGVRLRGVDPDHAASAWVAFAEVLDLEVSTS